MLTDVIHGLEFHLILERQEAILLQNALPPGLPSVEFELDFVVEGFLATKNACKDLILVNKACL